MDSAVVVRGAFVNQAFVPEGPLPEVDGRAELIIYTKKPEETKRPSIFDVFGKAERLRTAAAIDAQLGEERSSWEES